MEQTIFLQVVLSEKLRYCEYIARVFIERHWINSCKEDGSVAELEELMGFSAGIWSALIYEQQMIDPVPKMLLDLLYTNVSKMQAMEDLEKTVNQFAPIGNPS